MSRVRIAIAAQAAGILALTAVTNAFAAHVVVVTPSNQHGWSTADTRPGGQVKFVHDATSPYPAGALELTTNASTTAKAQYLHPTDTPLKKVRSLSYWTKQVSAPFPGADPAYQLPTCLQGITGNACTAKSFTTLVFEPYQNPAMGPVVPQVWQKWNVAKGLFWSTRTVNCSRGVIAGTPGGPATYTLDMVKAACPEAIVVQFGVNIGSNNPSYVVRTDGFQFNSTIYDFQLSGEEREDEDEAGDRDHHGGRASED